MFRVFPTNSGLWFGFLLGLIQMGVALFWDNPWSLSIGGGIVGLVVRGGVHQLCPAVDDGGGGGERQRRLSHRGGVRIHRDVSQGRPVGDDDGGCRRRRREKTFNLGSHPKEPRG